MQDHSTCTDHFREQSFDHHMDPRSEDMTDVVTDSDMFAAN